MKQRLALTDYGGDPKGDTMSIPLVKIDQYTVTGLPEPKPEAGRIRCGRHITVQPGDSRMHFAGFGYVSGEVAMQLVRELLAGYVLVEQDQATRQ